MRTSSRTYAPPRTTAEEILAGIAAELLGRDRVGIHDNFFEIGVDSILGIQLVSRARQAGLAVDPAQLFRTRRSPAWRRPCRVERDQADESSRSRRPSRSR